MKNHKNFFRVIAVLIVLGLVFVFFFGSFSRRFFANVRVPVGVGNGIVSVARVDRVKAVQKVVVQKAIVQKNVVQKTVVQKVVSDVAVVRDVLVQDQRIVVA